MEYIQQIEEYLSDETKLYQDWYTGLFEESEDAQYTTEVGVMPDLDKLKQFFEKWFKKQQTFLKKVCDDYCQHKQQQQQPSLLAAAITDSLGVFVGNFPINLPATATILVAGGYLDHICHCPKTEPKDENTQKNEE